MNAQEVVGLALERVAWRGRHSEEGVRPSRLPLMLDFPPLRRAAGVRGAAEVSEHRG